MLFLSHFCIFKEYDELKRNISYPIELRIRYKFEVFFFFSLEN